VKPGLRVFVSIPTVLVAVYCLMTDAGLGLFIKKVGATYIFFNLLSFVLGAMWDAARPAPMQRSNQSAGTEGAQSTPQTTRKTTNSASNGPAVQTAHQTAEPAKTDALEIAAGP
jgi:hypothetical protein